MNCGNTGLSNGLPPVRHQAITWTKADLLSIGAFGKKQWNLKRNFDIFIQGNTLENVICEMEAILSRWRWAACGRCFFITIFITTDVGIFFNCQSFLLIRMMLLTFWWNKYKLYGHSNMSYCVHLPQVELLRGLINTYKCSYYWKWRLREVSHIPIIAFVFSL